MNHLRKDFTIFNRFKRTGKRNEIFLATKFGATSDYNRPINGSPEYVREAVARSLKNLQTDTIDLYYLHRPDKTVPIEVWHSSNSLRYAKL